MQPKRLPKTVLLSVLVLLFLKSTIRACPLELPTTIVSINGHPLTVELAATPESRRCGLSNRASLGESRGMLFIYQHAAPRTFWMKDTWIPLSIAFLDQSGIIINIEAMSPGQTVKRYHSRLPAAYALEVNQGWFLLNGIEVGDKVDIRQAGITDGPR
jgi:hypothetical protein